MFQFTYKLKVSERVKAKCDRHPRYNPEKDGRGGMKGGCSGCFALFDLHQARQALDVALREFLRRAASVHTQNEVNSLAKPDWGERGIALPFLTPNARQVRSLPAPSLSPQEQRRQERWARMFSRNRTDLVVQNMLHAIDAPLYDVAVLSDRGMMPGLDGIPAEKVLSKLPLLKQRNATGLHIYIRPSGEHRYTVLDDLDVDAVATLMLDGFEPCAVVETSSGNFQAWLRNAGVFPKLLGTLAAQTLAARYGADPSAADWRRFGQLPGFTNCKPKYRQATGLFPFVRLCSYGGKQRLFTRRSLRFTRSARRSASNGG